MHPQAQFPPTRPAWPCLPCLALQAYYLRFGRPRGADEEVTLDEIAAYYPPLTLTRLLPGVSAKQRSPLAITREILRTVKDVPYDEAPGREWNSRERLAMVSLVNKLQHCIGASERIVQTPVPLHYVHYTSRFLSTWCFALPLCLVSRLGLLTAPLMAFVSWALFGLREIGVLIENPFQRSLQIQTLSHSIRVDVSDMLGLPSGRGLGMDHTATSRLPVLPLDHTPPPPLARARPEPLLNLNGQPLALLQVNDTFVASRPARGA